MCVTADPCEPEHSRAEKVRALVGESGERATALGSSWHHRGRTAGVCPEVLIPGHATQILSRSIRTEDKDVHGRVPCVGGGVGE